MYQSGLLFTKIEFTCANSTNYCDCDSTNYTLPFWSGNLITEFNLYRDEAYLVGLSDLCFFGGALFSGTFGFFLDKFSRKWTLLLCSLLTTLLTGIQATSVLSGNGLDSLSSSTKSHDLNKTYYVYLTEILHPNVRSQYMPLFDMMVG